MCVDVCASGFSLGLGRGPLWRLVVHATSSDRRAPTWRMGNFCPPTWLEFVVLFLLLLLSASCVAVAVVVVVAVAVAS